MWVQEQCKVFYECIQHCHWDMTAIAPLLYPSQIQSQHSQSMHRGLYLRVVLSCGGETPSCPVQTLTPSHRPWQGNWSDVCGYTGQVLQSHRGLYHMALSPPVSAVCHQCVVVIADQDRLPQHRHTPRCLWHPVPAVVCPGAWSMCLWTHWPGRQSRWHGHIRIVCLRCWQRDSRRHPHRLAGPWLAVDGRSDSGISLHRPLRTARRPSVSCCPHGGDNQSSHLSPSRSPWPHRCRTRSQSETLLCMSNCGDLSSLHIRLILGVFHKNKTRNNDNWKQTHRSGQCCGSTWSRWGDRLSLDIVMLKARVHVSNSSVEKIEAFFHFLFQVVNQFLLYTLCPPHHL